MKNIFNYIFVGFIQGITEFLPISSSGHIVIFGSIIGLDDLMLYSVFAHLGTLFAVIFCYRSKILPLIKRPFNKTNLNLILATIPTIVIVLVFHSWLDESFSIHSIVWGFSLSAILLTISDFIKIKSSPITHTKSLFMGLGQGIAILPGISRSGTTLCFGLLAGVDKKEALDFSFLMSIPVILCSVIYECMKLDVGYINMSIMPILVVAISSFVFGILSIKIMLKLIKNNKLYYFAIYLLILSFILLIFF